MGSDISKLSSTAATYGYPRSNHSKSSRSGDTIDLDPLPTEAPPPPLPVNNVKNYTKPPRRKPANFSWKDYWKDNEVTNLLINDKGEGNRSVVLHNIMKILFNGKYIAPVAEILECGGKVLDIGCGTGLWGYEVANEFPRCSVFGIDKTDEFLNNNPRPPNFFFKKWDIHQGLPYPDNYFDYVSFRFMMLTTTKDQWPILAKELTRVTKGRGFIELVDSELNLHSEIPCPRYDWISTQICNRMENVGLDPYLGKKFHSTLERDPSVIFVNNGYFSYTIGNVGMDSAISTLMRTPIALFLMSLSDVLGKTLGVSEKEWPEYVKQILDEIAEKDGYYNVYYAYGQKSQFF